jgi:GDPmannose 4,6-dehydratase
VDRTIPKEDLVRSELPGVKLINGDLTDTASLFRALDTSAPDEVYNLGAISYVAYSWDQAQLTSQVTALGVLNLLEAIRINTVGGSSKPKFYQASSSEMFGKVQDVPQRESTSVVATKPIWCGKSIRSLHDN